MISQFESTKIQAIHIDMTSILHPLLDNGLTKGVAKFPGGKLHCHCSVNKVEVVIAGNVLYNHACGCSKCWKPPGALFSIVGAVPIDNVKITANKDKLTIVDQNTIIQRYSCKQCGVHLFGRIEKEHPLKGLDFIHIELSDEKGWQEPQFAAFVTSIIDQGFDPKGLDSIRLKFKSYGLETYDEPPLPLIDDLSVFISK
jgi:S-(hydroxymethyl)glutathione synthase